MKEAKSDKISSLSNTYLKKRNIDERCLSDECKDDIDLGHAEHAGLQSLVIPSSPNSFAYSTTTSQYPFIEQQYIKLKSWMTEASEPCRAELSQVLFPLFVHLYIELLSGAGRNAAKAFFTRHHQVFRVNRDYDHTLRQVCSIVGEANNSPVIQTLRSGKYWVRLSELTLNYFLRYLQTSGNPTLLQIFSNYIEVEISEMSGGNAPIAIFRLPDLAEEKEDKKPDCTTDEIDQLQEVITNVRNLKPSMPTICIYSVLNANNGLSAAKVDNESSLLACGFEDSIIKLWRLNPPPQMAGLLSETSPSTPIDNQEEVLFCNPAIGDDMDFKLNFERDEEEEYKGVGARHISGGEFLKLRGHRGPIFDVSFSHDSSYLYSVGEDSTMRLWNLVDGKTIAVYQGHHYPIWCVNVSPHTIYIATGSYDGTARLWTPECTYPLRNFCGHTGSVDCVAFHPNCSYLATGSKDKSIRLWQCTDSAVGRIFVQHESPITAISFSPNGKYLASGSECGEVYLWDLAAGKVLTKLGSSSSIDTLVQKNSSLCSQTESIASLCWTKDSSMIICATTDGSLKASCFNYAGTNNLVEVDNLYCGGNYSGGITLVNSSLSNHNFLTAVVAVHGER